MERNTSENGIIYMGETEFRILMVQLIVSHKFHHNNEMPSKVVLPAITEVDGVEIELAEVEHAISGGKTHTRK